MKHIIRRYLLHIVCTFIEASNDAEIMDITQCVTARYSKRFPDWEVSFLSLPRDPVQREDVLMRIIEFYRNHP